MKKLTPTRYVTRLLLRKVEALRKLSEMLGFIGKHPNHYNAEEIDDIMSAANIVVEPRSEAWQVGAASLLLDIYVQDWRDYIPGLSLDRDDVRVTRWRREIIKRDKCCVLCNSTERLEAHHILQWVFHPTLRLSLENGETLCYRCHKTMPRNRRNSRQQNLSRNQDNIEINQRTINA